MGFEKDGPGAWGVRVSLEPRRCRVSAWPRWEGSAWVRGAVGAGRGCWGARGGREGAQVVCGTSCLFRH